MSTLAQRISETPMAPYVDVMKSMTIAEKNVVVDFLYESIRESEEAKRKADDEFLAQKMAEVEIDPDIDELVNWLRLTPEEAADDRTRWILGLDRK